RDLIVTGVQTCALPIFHLSPFRDVEHEPLEAPHPRAPLISTDDAADPDPSPVVVLETELEFDVAAGVPAPKPLVHDAGEVVRMRSEERRVGKECGGVGS